MQAAAPAPEGSGISIDDVYYAVFRHKAKILVCMLAGLVAGAVAYLAVKPQYVSEAKLYVRYVVVEGMAQRPGADDLVTKSPDMRGETIMSSEQEIMTSLDLVRQVAQAIGPEKILATQGGGSDLNLATVAIRRGLSTNAPAYGSVIDVRFQHPDQTLVQPVLKEVIAQYLKNHVDAHRSSGMGGDFLNQETDLLRSQLSQTEDELRKARSAAGVVSIDDSKRSFTTQMAAIRQEIFASEAELAERTAAAQEIASLQAKAVADAASKDVAAKDAASKEAAPKDAASKEAAEKVPMPNLAVSFESAVPAAVKADYQSLLSRLDALREREQQMLMQFTAENPRVKETQALIAEAQTKKQQLETDHPVLTRPAAAAAGPAAASSAQPGRPPIFNTVEQTVQIDALQAKIKTLKAQLESVRGDIVNLDKAEGNIQELMRKKQLLESNYLHYAASLEQSRINEALGSGRVSNIYPIQNPSPPFVESTKALKVPLGVAGGGIGLGLALAFFIEMFWDRSVRRPVDVGKKLKLPLFISFPYFGEKRVKRLLPEKKSKSRKALSAPSSDTQVVPVPAAGGAALGPAGVVPPPSSPTIAESLLPFHDTLRDRLIGYFESRDLTHKPKLVAVTSINHGSGVSTTAAGLAKSLSETGDGNVLLVDMAPGNGAAQQFYRGKAVCGLEEMLSTRDSAQVQDRLFVIGNHTDGGSLKQAMAQGFRHLVPKLKASNFDYIIFDMPPVSQISITPRVAGFMDVVLLVTESEKDSVDLVQRANTLLVESKAHVGIVLNKTHNYVPVAIHREELGY